MKIKIFFLYFTTACLLCVLALSGCGNGNSPSAPQPGLQPPPPPDPVVSAEVEQASAQVLWQNYSKVYFIGTVQARNTGTADLENVYYRIEGKESDRYYMEGVSQPWQEWNFIAVTPPFSLPAGAVAAGSYEFNYSLDAIIQRTWPNYPKEYPVRFRLCLPDGTPLSSMTVIAYIP